MCLLISRTAIARRMGGSIEVRYVSGCESELGFGVWRGNLIWASNLHNGDDVGVWHGHLTFGDEISTFCPMLILRVWPGIVHADVVCHADSDWVDLVMALIWIVLLMMVAIGMLIETFKSVFAIDMGWGLDVRIFVLISIMQLTLHR